MLCRKFELILIKIGFLKKIFKVAPKSGQSPCTIVQGHWPNFMKNEKERISQYLLHYKYIYTYVQIYIVHPAGIAQGVRSTEKPLRDSLFQDSLMSLSFI